jgi:hypothetical protein
VTVFGHVLIGLSTASAAAAVVTRCRASVVPVCGVLPEPLPWVVTCLVVPSMLLLVHDVQVAGGAVGNAAEDLSGLYRS